MGLLNNFMCKRVTLVQCRIYILGKVSFIYLLVLFCFLLDRSSDLIRYTLHDYSEGSGIEGGGKPLDLKFAICAIGLALVSMIFGCG